MLPLQDSVVQHEFIFCLAILIQTSSACCATAAAFGPSSVTIKRRLRYTITLHTWQMSRLDQRKSYWCFLFFPHAVSPPIVQLLSLVPSPLFHHVRGLQLKSVLSVMKNYWLAPRCIDVPLARNREWFGGCPCSSAFREKGHDGAKAFEKGSVKHGNAWPKCKNFLLLSINKLHWPCSENVLMTV